MKKVAVIGHFAFGKEYLDGQTIKTKIVTKELERRLGTQNVLKIDSHGGKRKLLLLPFMLFFALKKSENVIILPAHNGLRVIAPLLLLENKLFHRKLHYVVIGGWLSEFISKRSVLTKVLKKIHCIYVETNTMKRVLIAKGFSNVEVMPNCKELKILEESDITYPTMEPYKLCTFSRVMKEKGIEDALNAVRIVNEQFDRVVYTLDIYGQVDPSQKDWFAELKSTFPDYVNYCGIVPFDKSTDVLKEYYILLFPTYYEGEGFAGTLIDAMAAGVPVIASNWKYNAEVIKDGETGFIYPAGDKEALIERLVACYTTRKKCICMKRKCVREVKRYLPNVVLGTLIDKL